MAPSDGKFVRQYLIEGEYVDLIPGQVYRRSELHEAFSGQQQGGISTPTGTPMVLLFTGEQGEQYGYADGFQPDGTFHYTGEGQRGNMELIRGNRAIAQHQNAGKSLVLFRYVHRGMVECVGPCRCIGYHEAIGPDVDGKPRSILVFELELLPTEEGMSSDAVEEEQEDLSDLWEQALDELRKAALAAGSAGKESGREAKRRIYERSKAVRAYVLKRSNGTCEGCRNEAPFRCKDGRAYLEPHHIRRRADGGPDHPRWVIALCPNCHRRVHHGGDGKEYNEVLAGVTGHLESDYA